MIIGRPDLVCGVVPACSSPSLAGGVCGDSRDDPALVPPPDRPQMDVHRGEIVKLLDLVERGRVNPALLVGITDDAKSPLASAADVFRPLHSGPEATVSTKSYLNTLGVHRGLSAAFASEPWDHPLRPAVPDTGREPAVTL
jgi:hypothetical protein